LPAEIVTVTDGKMRHALMKNIHTRIAPSLEGEDTVSIYDLTPNPRMISAPL